MMFIHPSLTETAFSFFKCEEFKGEEESLRLKVDLEMVCWEGIHMYWMVPSAVAIIMFWTVGLPLKGLFLVIREHKNGREARESDSPYLILCEGLRRKKFYWEFVNMFRKVAIICITVMPFS